MSTPAANQFFTLAPVDRSGLRQPADLPWALPHHLNPQVVFRLVEDLHQLLYDLNTQLDARGYEPMERLLDSAGFSGFISRAIADRIAAQSRALVLNRYHNGYPDLLPRDTYAQDSVAHGALGGLEVKASRYETGWQAHGQRAGWFCIVQFDLDLDEAIARRDRQPTKVVGVYVAELEQDDWSWQPAAEGKIRSGTASVKPVGMEKLRSGAVWVDPAYAKVHLDRLEKLRMSLFESDKADAAVLAAVTAAGTGLHPIEIATAVAPKLGITNARKLIGRVTAACKRLTASGALTRTRNGRRFVYSV
jgi:hypothetical protein